MNKNAILLVNSANGIYIPQVFRQNFGHVIKNSIDLTDYLLDLEDVYGEYYWDSWDYLLSNAVLLMGHKEYYLWQDDDLWAIPRGESPNEEVADED
jgi:hypothetical protein